MNNQTSNIQSLFQALFHKNVEEVKHTLKEIGRVGRGNREAMKALQEFLGKEQRMPLRILAAQTISKIFERKTERDRVIVHRLSNGKIFEKSHFTHFLVIRRVFVQTQM